MTESKEFSAIASGIDIVDVGRLASRLEQYPRLAARLFSHAERDYCSACTSPEESLAARFAAKEAAFKALGTGWPEISWLDVEVVSDRGRPALRFGGRAAQLAGGCETSVSLSHDSGLAVAQVVILRTSPARDGQDRDGS